MREASTLRFIDMETSSNAVAIVRYDSERVAICLSIESGSDSEVVMNKRDAKALLAALTVATE